MLSIPRACRIIPQALRALHLKLFTSLLKIYRFDIEEIMELHQLTIHELQEKIRSGSVSATQIT
ncbi:MAG: hypothetical protein CVU72_03550, partial [Deltaproteobacteria bacterium HGW-Deltaproteobacteria-7]